MSLDVILPKRELSEGNCLGVNCQGGTCMGDNCPKWELSGGQLSSVIIVQGAMVQDAVVQGELPCPHVKHVAPKNELKFYGVNFWKESV